MYEEYWGLKEKPFENTADPRFLYKSPQHEEALTRLRYAVDENKGIAVLTGVFGCGKTLIAEKLMETISKGAYEIAFIVNPRYSPIELLRDIVYNLGVREKLTDQKDEVVHKLAEVLHNNFDNGKHSVIIIDEAHLIEEVHIFEELRVLLNFQHNHKFLLTLLLLGQPQLKEKINNIKQFSQRISIRYHLVGLDRKEVAKYIQHRLWVADASKPIFKEEDYNYIFKQSGGIPRRINQICDMALFTGYCEGRKTIDTKTIEMVVEDLEA
jgi:type II secretory pathway predicted ATPase ExeA